MFQLPEPPLPRTIVSLMETTPPVWVKAEAELLFVAIKTSTADRVPPLWVKKPLPETPMRATLAVNVPPDRLKLALDPSPMKASLASVHAPPERLAAPVAPRF